GLHDRALYRIPMAKLLDDKEFPPGKTIFARDAFALAEYREGIKGGRLGMRLHLSAQNWEQQLVKYLDENAKDNFFFGTGKQKNRQDMIAYLKREKQKDKDPKDKSYKEPIAIIHFFNDPTKGGLLVAYTGGGLVHDCSLFWESNALTEKCGNHK